MQHIPVLLKEVTENLKIQKDFRFIDCTAGAGGHIKKVLEINPKAKILGIDLDQTTLGKLKKEFAASGLDQNVKLISGNYVDLEVIAKENSFDSVNAILLDLGFSSMQIDDPERGFSFQTKGPLDMRFDQSQKLTAENIVNNYPETKLEKIIKEYGEDNFAKKIAHHIARERQVSPLRDTSQILDVIRSALPASVRHKASDSARRVFQALRIEVNHELENVEKILPVAVKLLKPGGRLLVISFHSLEDRIVKNFFREQSKGCVCPIEFPVCVCGKNATARVITKKPITASEQELEQNPRSKPAKLRVLEINN